jgi:hypothetical protein
MKLVCVYSLLAAMMISPALAAVPDSDNFDGGAPFTIGADFASGLDTWKSDTAATCVAADAGKFQGTASVNVNSGTLSNNVNQATPSGVVWTEFQIIPALGVAPATDPDATVNHAHYYGTNGLLNVWNGAAWVEVTEDIHGGVIPVATTNSFVRISIYQNFTSDNSALLIDGQVVLQDFAFPGSSDNYDTFSVQSLETGPAYMDTYSVGSTVPSSTDGNGNITADAQELNDNDYVARNFIAGNGAGAHYASLTGVAAVVRSGDTITLSGAVAGGGTATFSANVTISGAGGSFTVGSDFTVSAGYTVTVDNVSLDVATATIDGTLVVAGSGDALTSTDLTMGAGGTIDSNGGSWGTDSPVVQLTGTFDISASAYNTPSHASDLNYADDFEQYTAGNALADLTFRGWGASSTSSVIQTTKVKTGSNAATVSGVVSNRINGLVSQTKVWTDFQICAAQGAEPASPNTSSSALFYMTTNGYLAVYDGGGFVEQSTNASGGAVSPIGTNTWTRVTVFTDYDTDEAAIFLDDQLLIEQVSFPSAGASAYSLLSIESTDNDASIDDVNISTLVPTDLLVALSNPGDARDVDQDGRPDAGEIQLHGTLNVLGPLWTMFIFN